MNNLIIGVDNFGEAIGENLPFVDKSLFIKEIFDNAGVKASVIVRPRRFGKTFNLSMLRHFLAKEVNGLKTQGMFDNLAINRQGDDYMRHQGEYPVIFISFKDMKHDSYEDAYKGLALLMSATYSEHAVLLSGDILLDHEKKVFEDILWKRASTEEILTSLLNLSNYLYRYYKVKPWLLIDEYDTPIQSGYLNHHYQEIIGLMRGLLSSALKGNDNINRAIVTGILRIAKENLFSGLNNVKIFSVLNIQYADHFGFTEAEVDAELQKNNLEHLAADIKNWYNGYRIGGRRIYNPWSIANCLYDRGAMRPYWVNTSDNLLIKRTMARADAATKIQFESVLAGDPIEVMINENMTFAELNKSDALWSLLLFSGYLTALEERYIDTQVSCLLQTPNQEIAALYRDIIREWFDASLGKIEYHKFLMNLVEGRLENFLSTLQRFLKESTSYFDVKGRHPEKFYHGFVLGLMVGLADTHLIQSNKESGDGRYDVLIIPKDLEKLGLVLEFKVAEEGATLQVVAEEALIQINNRNYETELRQKGVRSILKVGLAFEGKEVAMAFVYAEA
jgi:hypothetical protein